MRAREPPSASGRTRAGSVDPRCREAAARARRLAPSEPVPSTPSMRVEWRASTSRTLEAQLEVQPAVDVGRLLQRGHLHDGGLPVVRHVKNYRAAFENADE